MSNLVPLDRRAPSPEALYRSRRRYARVSVTCDVFYDSKALFWISEEANVSLRGLFIPTGNPDAEGTAAVVRLDTGEGALLKLDCEVLRSPQIGRTGMALKILAISDADRFRLAAFLLRRGGLQVMPQLDRKFRTMTRAPRPRLLKIA